MAQDVIVGHGRGCRSRQRCAAAADRERWSAARHQQRGCGALPRRPVCLTPVTARLPRCSGRGEGVPMRPLSSSRSTRIVVRSRRPNGTSPPSNRCTESTWPTSSAWRSTRPATRTLPRTSPSRCSSARSKRCPASASRAAVARAPSRSGSTRIARHVIANARRTERRHPVVAIEAALDLRAPDDPAAAAEARLETQRAWRAVMDLPGRPAAGAPAATRPRAQRPRDRARHGPLRGRRAGAHPPRPGQRPQPAGYMSSGQEAATQLDVALGKLLGQPGAPGHGR